MSTQLVLASTTFGLATACAALDAGLLGAPERRVLVVSTNVAMPEGSGTLLDLPGADTLVRRFDRVVDHNATLEPLHPSGWAPRAAELPLWERHLRSVWSLGDDDVDLVLESPAVDPARALARVFADAPVTVYADGLMSYGPTRTALPDSVACRVEALLHLDLVPGLVPLLLSEWAVPTRSIPGSDFRAVVAALPSPPPATHPTTLVLGQYLAAGGLVTAEEEAELYADMIVRCAESGHRRIVFKAHPSAPPAYRDRLQEAADSVRADLVVLESHDLAETWFAAGSLDLVVGCFSTALLTANTLYGLTVAQLGTELVLERLTPYQNSNRIPATLVDALVPDLRSWTASPDGLQTEPVDVGALVTAVGYAMQPVLLSARREEAVSFLEARPGLRRRYVKRRRLTALDLPGAVPRTPWPLAAAKRVLALLPG